MAQQQEDGGHLGVIKKVQHETPRLVPEEIFFVFAFLQMHLMINFFFFCTCSFRDVLHNNTVADMPHHLSLSVTVCEPTAMSEAVVMEASRADGFLESSCAVGDSAASLDDAILDTAKYVHINTFTLTPLSWFPTWVLEEGSFQPV